jgi:N6-adenosine-specific RNA methylase IME4
VTVARYRTIVADPPWPISAAPAWFREDRRSSRERALGVNPVPYQTMTIDEIKALSVAAWADRTAHLYLWTITDYLEQSFDVARCWGFEPSSVLVWCKPEQPGGLGGTFPANVEFIIFATRRVGGDRVLELTAALSDRADQMGVSRADVDAAMGTSDMGGWWLSRLAHRCACPTDEQWLRLRQLLAINDPTLDSLVSDINREKGESTAIGRAAGRWFTWPRGGHSQKPDAFVDLVEQVSPGPYLELFARRQRLGWDTWGNEALEHVELSA